MMIEGTKRRQEILQRLQSTEKPISASRFAQELGVSRQIIVGDVALLRAAGEEVIATARGYKLNQAEDHLGYTKKIAVQHDASKTQEELETIVANGGEIIDVIVEHELYGELTGGLHIKTPKDVTAFMEAYRKSNVGLLSDLTNGIHLHTIRYQNDADLEKITQALAAKGILYQQ